jgi:hypothetical protein
MFDRSTARRCRHRPDRRWRAVERGALGLLAVALVAAGCVVPPSGDVVPPPVQVIGADARALRYGASAAEILTHPQFRDRVPALYGADWGPAPGGPPTALRSPVPEFFARTESLRLLQVGDRLYVAAMGCPATGCAGRRGLLLVSEDGIELLSRLDEGGLTHYYVQGPRATATLAARAVLDAAWWAMRSTARRASPTGEA